MGFFAEATMKALSYFFIAEAICSALAFLLFAADKWFAIRHTRRIRERTLLGCMWLLGAPGALLSMLLFRHKTNHPIFWMTGVCALLSQLAIAWLLVAAGS